jgi:hypothetical protein
MGNAEGVLHLLEGHHRFVQPQLFPLVDEDRAAQRQQ